jgi:hypothetical protein
MTSSCRMGANFRGPSICDGVVIDAERAAELDVSPIWCDTYGHATIIAAAKRSMSGRESIKAKSTSTAAAQETRPQLPAGPSNKLAAYRTRLAEEAQERADAVADSLVEYVVGAGTWPVSRKAAAQHVGGDNAAFRRALASAIDAGRIVVLTQAGPRRSGYYAPGAVPDDLKPAVLATT